MKIVLLPGLDGTGDFFGPLQDALAPDFDVQVIAYPEDMARYSDLVSFVEPLLPKSDFILLGESFGGPLAAMLAARSPKGLKGVVFAVTFARKPRPYPAFLSHLIRFLPTGRTWFGKLVFWGARRKSKDPELERIFLGAAGSISARVFAERVHQTMRVDLRAEVNNLDIPALYLKAKRDFVIRRNAWRDFERAGIPVKAIQSTHFLLYENAEDAAKAIADFSSQLD